MSSSRIPSSTGSDYAFSRGRPRGCNSEAGGIYNHNDIDDSDDDAIHGDVVMNVMFAVRLLQICFLQSSMIESPLPFQPLFAFAKTGLWVPGPTAAAACRDLELPKCKTISLYRSERRDKTPIELQLSGGPCRLQFLQSLEGIGIVNHRVSAVLGPKLLINT